MEEHYIKDVGKITYVYDVNLEEHKTVIEKQQKRIAELEQDLEFTTKTANELIEIKHKLEQEFAELKEKYNKASEKLKNITEEVENNFVHGQDYEKLKQELAELKEKAIVPRFEYGDKVYYIKYFVGKWQVFNQEYVGENISNIIVRTMNYYSELPKDSVFATEQEAQAKLKEIQGNE